MSENAARLTQFEGRAGWALDSSILCRRSPILSCVSAMR